MNEAEQRKAHENWQKHDQGLTILGGMIDHYISLWHIEFVKESKNTELVKSLDEKIRELEKERHQLTMEGSWSQILIKADMVYRPFLQKEFLKKKDMDT